MKIDYKISDRFDYGLFLSMFALSIFGLIAIYSSTFNHPTASGNFEKQLFWFILSMIAFLVIYFLPNQFIKFSSYYVYGISILFLILVLLLGKRISGSKSWLSFGAFGFQPAEIAKIGTILLLSVWLSDMKRNMSDIKDIAIALLIGGFPIFLILLEPDMGTSIVFTVITITMVYWSGISSFTLFVVLSPIVIVATSLFGVEVLIISMFAILAILIYYRRNLFISASIFLFNLASGFIFDYINKILLPHQQKRILTFLDPGSDPLGSGYNALQAKVAIGSGGIVGKGFLKGSQTQLRFIPEQWTDFIYCVIGEEFGFIGSVSIIILYLILFSRLLKLTSFSKDNFNSLVIIGILTLLFVQFGINIGMNLGITPVIGITLPFLSYGGSSFLANTVLIAIAANIYRNKKNQT